MKWEMARHIIKLAGALVALAGLYSAWLWVRDSPAFAVQSVQVSGISGASASEVRSTLEEAARQMTTTHIDIDRLRAAVAPYVTVADLKVATQLPHGVRIAVTEQLPTMALVVGGVRLPVGPKGLVLRGRLSPSVPVPDVGANAIPANGVVRGAPQLRALKLLDVAPLALRKRILRVADAAQGLTAYLRAGPQLLFGDTSRLHAKWAAASRVLADPSSRGARYIDLRVPDRPAAQVGDPATLSVLALAGPTTAGGGGGGGDVGGAGVGPAGIGTRTAGGVP